MQATAVDLLESNVIKNNPLFLDQIPVLNKRIYMAIKNSTKQPITVVLRQLRKNLMARGFRVIKNPNQADYILQANILKIEKLSGAESSEVVTGCGLFTGDSLSKSYVGLIQKLRYRLIADIQIDDWVRKGSKPNQCYARIDQVSSDCVLPAIGVEHILTEAIMVFFK
ncbi:MAG: hypothetical protein H0U75_07650 [Legionella sp.]|nr:hypothetical protein [Legionella sp.]